MRYLFEFLRDVRYGLRVLADAPGFTLVAVLSLSLGIAIATCAFSEMNGMVWRTIPAVSHPDELAALQLPISYPDYLRFSKQTDLFSSTTAYVAPVPFAVWLDGKTERTWGHLVTPSYFPTLGVRPVLGHFFGPEYEQPGQAPAIVVSYRYWQDRLGASRQVIGSTLRVNGQPVTVIGVGPRDFLGASPMILVADIWMPLSVGERIAPELAGNTLERHDRPIFNMAGRWKPGVALSAAEAELDTIAKAIQRENGDERGADHSRRVALVEGGKMLPVRKQDLPFFTSFFMIMAGLVMMIACANVANMMLARATSRSKEIAVRLSLGASRWRLIRQLLAESLLIALAAGLCGFAMSAWLMSLLSHVRMPLPMPVAYDLRPDSRALGFTIALSCLTGIGFGLLPALQATRTDLPRDLGRTSRRWSLRNVLMVSQIAGSLSLLVILGLLSAGIQSTLSIQRGFDPSHLYLLRVDPVRDGYTAAQTSSFLDRLLERVQRLRGVTAACITESVPVSLPSSSVTFRAKDGAIRSAVRHIVGRGYFQTAGIPMIAGRDFGPADEKYSLPVVVVNEVLARTLGQRLELENDRPAATVGAWPASNDYRQATGNGSTQIVEVVGVVGNVAEGLVVGKPRAAIYFPLRPTSFSQPSISGITLMFRGVAGSDAMKAVQEELRALDSKVSIIDAISMPEHVARFMAPLESAAWTYGSIGIFGLVLAAVGLAGVTAYSVTRRNREIGIRMALGARTIDVLRLVMMEATGLIVAGLVAGECLAWAGSRGLAALSSAVGQVTTTSASDPLIIVGAPVLLASLALAASYLPARRSTQIDPAEALRQE